MQQDSRNALLTLALFAAFADGHKADREREAIRRIAESLSDDQGGRPLATLYQDVLLQRVTVQGAVA
ncbi:MAG: GTPase, partial [Giesbergeria sp.]